jgi:hypothetical protein
MVSPAIFEKVMLAQQAVGEGADRKIPEPTRTIVLMALLGIVLVGMMLIVATMLGAHWVRRQGERRRGPVVPTDVMLPRAASPGHPVVEPPHGVSSAETFVGDDTVRNDDTVVS